MIVGELCCAQLPYNHGYHIFVVVWGFASPV
jgi:hypothetical protein